MDRDVIPYVSCGTPPSTCALLPVVKDFHHSAPRDRAWTSKVWSISDAWKRPRAHTCSPIHHICCSLYQWIIKSRPNSLRVFVSYRLDQRKEFLLCHSDLPSVLQMFDWGWADRSQPGHRVKKKDGKTLWRTSTYFSKQCLGLAPTLWTEYKYTRQRKDRWFTMGGLYPSLLPLVCLYSSEIG